MRNKGALIFPFLLLIGIVLTYAQPYKPYGRFLKTEIKVGEQVDFVLTFNYLKDSLVVFPDSNYNFGQFELVSKQYFPSKIVDSLSFDSTIYTLRTFELSDKATLSLPVYLLNGQDTFRVHTRADTINIKHLVSELPDEIVLKKDLSYHQIEEAPNHYLSAAIIIGIVIILIALFILLRKPLLKRWKLYRMSKKHETYLQSIEHILAGNKGQKQAQSFLSTWKKYLEEIERAPISTMTSRELATKYHNIPNIKNHLERIDKVIYAGLPDDALKTTFKDLQEFSLEMYSKKRKDLIHE